MRPSRRSRSAALSPPPRRRGGFSPRALSFSVAVSESFSSRGGVGIAVVASAGSAGGWPDDWSRGICSARVSSADGCGGVGPAPRGSPVFPPRKSLSQDSISRSSPRAGWRGPLRRSRRTSGRRVRLSREASRRSLFRLGPPWGRHSRGAGGRWCVRSRRPEVRPGRRRSRSARPRRTLGAGMCGVVRWTGCRRDRRAGGGRRPRRPCPRRRQLALVGQVNLAEPQPVLQALHPHRGPPAVVAEQLHHRRAPGTSGRRWRPAAAPPSDRTPGTSSSPGRRTRTSRRPRRAPMRPR